MRPDLTLKSKNHTCIEKKVPAVFNKHKYINTNNNVHRCIVLFRGEVTLFLINGVLKWNKDFQTRTNQFIL